MAAIHPPVPPIAAARAGCAGPTPWHPLALLGILALWLATAGNLPFWKMFLALPEATGLPGLRLALTLGAAIFAVTLAALCLVVWPAWRRLAGIVLLVSAAVASHFMLAYGVVIDASMLHNAVATDPGEVRDLLSGSMVAALLLGVLLPGAWWWRQRARPVGAMRLARAQLGLAALALVAGALVAWSSFHDLAPLLRNHRALRHAINPWNTVNATGQLAARAFKGAGKPLEPVGTDARAAVAGDPDHAPLFVLVVGETARAANFGLGGYGRDTTPELARLREEGDLVYFDHVSACGTSTQVSVPCMFSGLPRDKADDAARRENLLDVLHHAGLAVLWLDNQSGCKGVCDRVDHAGTREAADPALCAGGECLDEVMIRGLPERLAALDPARRARGTVLVLHQMGSHGPAYHKRSPKESKRFLPECTSAALQDCDREQVVNTYDNSIAYTDRFLAATVQWLRAQDRPTALLYVSDHGESLGEKGLYLHGMPWAIAPEEQTHVPMLAWFSRGLQRERGLSVACVRDRAGRAWSHENLFDTMLGLAGVRTTAADPRRDILGGCGRQEDVAI